MTDEYTLPRKVTLNYAQEEALIEARVSFMTHCPLFAYYYNDQIVEYYTDEIDTLATDSKRVFINPDYFLTLKPMERAFTLAHEVYHVIYKHPQKSLYYSKQGHIEDVPYDADLLNRAADYVINADLIANKIGTCNPSWLYDPKFTGDMAVEDVYKELFQQGGPCPPPQGQPPGGQPGQGQPTTGSGNPSQNPVQGPPPSTYGQHKRTGGRPDKRADDAQGRFDEVRAPYQDPVSGKTDIPSDMEFREAVARATAAAKAMGKLLGSFKRMVDEILEPQIQWRDHLRLTITGKIGMRRETWDTPNRRRIVLNPPVYLPGRRGHGANDVTVVIDNSGSISERELSTFFSEAGAIIADCRPKLVRVIWCDAAVRRVEEARSLDELAHIRCQGSDGGGGTSFMPPFTWLIERHIRPDTTIYFTDMEGRFPPEAPTYPVIWCSTTPGKKAPFGETIHVKV